MTRQTTDLDTISRPAAPALANLTQATAIEQARAVAEVQAAVTVAQARPRDTQRAIAEMRDTCGRMAVASRAFYSVPNRGNGPTVHLARELARIWGNLDYSVRELRRDDEAGESEVMAVAWDQQANVRSSRSFIAPHAKMKGRERVKLVDLDDVYRSNQNTGAKAVRECILAVLPRWFVEEAQDVCRQTLNRGEGVPLSDRIAAMVRAFREQGISAERLEARSRKKRGQWDAGDVAQLGIDFVSITRDGVDAESLFPEQPVTIAELGAFENPLVDGKSPMLSEGDPA